MLNRCNIIALCFFLAGIVSEGHAADSTPLDSLKEKYAAARGQIDRVAFVNYTNGLFRLLQQSKTRGDVDACLLLQCEQKEVASLPIIPTAGIQTNLAASVTGYGAMVAASEADRADQLANLNRSYVIRLDALLRELLMADRLEEAKRVKEEKDAVLSTAKPVLGKAKSGTEENTVNVVTSINPSAAAPATIVSPATISVSSNTLKIIKATVTGPGVIEDVTDLIQERVVDSKLEIRDLAFLRGKLSKRSWAKGVHDKMTLVVQYKYKNGPLKTLRSKFSEPIRIAE